MAYYAALVSLMQLLEEEISIDHDRFQKLPLSKKQIMEPLHEKLGLLLASVEDYSSKGDEAADVLERRIREVAYKAQDVIESQIDDESACRELIGKVNVEVDSIVEELMRIKRSRMTEDLQPQNYFSSDSTQAALRAMVGVDDDLKKLKEQLCRGSSKLEVIPIVGMGGIGKTTLARNILDDKFILGHFGIRVWVTVSQDYHIQKVLRTILDSTNFVSIDEFREVRTEELPMFIHKLLKRRRYLIIMDDVWDTKVWDDVRRIFPDDDNGSRVMITSRLSDVAGYAGTYGSLHQMQFLDEEHSWDLLKEKVFAQQHCAPELEEIGKSIANNCRGLPLAIVMVAGLLSKVDRTRHEWENIASNVCSAVMSNGEHFAKILFLSYYHLPHHLKPCFLYIGCFPEDYEISVTRLVKLWVAEGFLRKIGCKSLEEVGEEYLGDLVRRNLVLITKKRSNGEFKFCGVHNLLRGVCRERVSYENFFHATDENGCFYPEGVGRRVCLYPCQQWSSVGSDDIGSHVRSVLCLDYPQTLISFVLGFKLLRVLDALEIIFSSFPVEILKLFHLRYLAFRVYTRHTIKIPPSISKLQNLQTLVVEGFISLPSQIWMMPQLRHVLISNMNLSPFDATIFGDELDHVLENLQTLSTVENFRFTKKAVEMIPNLKKLKVCCVGICKSTWQEYCLDKLVHLQKLEKLEIVFKESNDSFERLPESFAFPYNLKKLSLCGCKIAWEDLTLVGTLPNLEILKLLCNAVSGEEWVPIEGEFVRLKFLLMEELDLKYWRADDFIFPRLEHLEIRHCKNLEEIPLEIGELPTLQLIKVCRSKLAADSAVRIQEEQESYGNEDIQVRVCHI